LGVIPESLKKFATKIERSSNLDVCKGNRIAA